MHWLFAALTGIGFVELLIYFPIIVTLSRFRHTFSRVFAIVTSPRISDHWKERALREYACRLSKLTMSLAFYLVAAFVPFMLLSAAAITVRVPFLEFALSFTGSVFITFFSIGYAKVRLLRVTRGI